MLRDYELCLSFLSPLPPVSVRGLAGAPYCSASPPAIHGSAVAPAGSLCITATRREIQVQVLFQEKLKGYWDTTEVLLAQVVKVT